MHHTTIRLSENDLRGAERRVVHLLRAWRAGEEAQTDVWNDLCQSIGPVRAQSCLDAFDQMMHLFRRHGWHGLSILAIGTDGVSADEADLARFVIAATEQRRESALVDATFLVRPNALLPLVHAASRFGLPLLCEESRCALYAHVGTHSVN